MQEELLITIIGGGLAGCEAAWQAACAGVRVRLWEMKPFCFTPAHHSPDLAELVCSNSFRSASLENAVGLLKEEMRRMQTLFMYAADQACIPAGGALAVDRERFSAIITTALQQHKTIDLVRQEVTKIPLQRPLIIASGPLTSESLSKAIQELVGEQYLSFYDAISPVVEADSITMEKAFWGSRYNRGGDDYLNCPLSRNEYYHFVDEVLRAEQTPWRDFEQPTFFEGCLPIEVMAARGRDTLAFGPMKPIGLTDPGTGKQPFAVVQLRPENQARTIFNLVGFQTKMTRGEQQRVLRLIPALENAQFVRLGSCHRNSFINSPKVLAPTLQLHKDTGIFFAGQVTGVEGYVESAAMGMVAGINAARLLRGKPLILPPETTAVGALIAHVSNSNAEHFQPMNVNFGLFPPLESHIKKKERRMVLAERALSAVDAWKQDLGKE